MIATPLLSSCDRTAGAGRASAAAAAGGSAALTTRWLIRPDASAEPPLAAPIAMAVDGPRGRLYLLEAQPPAVRVYAAGDGRYLTTLGAEGDGPGEYRHPISLAVDEESGTCAVLSVAGRVTFWGPGGGLRGTLRVEPGGLATDVVPAGQGAFYVKVDRFPPADVSAFYRVTPVGIDERPIYEDGGLAELSIPAGSIRNHAYAVAAGPEGLLIALPGAEYRILRVGSRGRAEEFASRDLAPLRRDEEEIRRIRANVRRGFARVGRRAPERLLVPPFRPQVVQLAVAPDGEVWALAGRGSEGDAVLDRFDPRGRRRATYRVPLRVAALAIDQDHLYLLARSELDLPAVAVVNRPYGRLGGTP